MYKNLFLSKKGKIDISGKLTLVGNVSIKLLKYGGYFVYFLCNFEFMASGVMYAGFDSGFDSRIFFRLVSAFSLTEREMFVDVIRTTGLLHNI